MEVLKIIFKSTRINYDNIKMYITIIGTGYVGLVSGVILADLGHEVDCIDINSVKVNLLRSGRTTIYEPALDNYLEKNVRLKKIRFFDSYYQVNPSTEIVFITVDTPSDSSGDADLKNIYKSVDEISKKVNENCLIIIKSTVPPGTTENIRSYLLNKGYNFELGFNPEFLKEGCAVSDFLYPDRIIIGVRTEQARIKLETVYKSFIDKNIPLIITDIVTAELIKYASNAFLATKIAFINEIASLTERLGADISLLADGVGADSRVGKGFLKVGPGFGGSCLPKDISALIKLAEDCNINLQILSAVKKSNDDYIVSIATKVKNILNGLYNKKVAVWGLTFKSGTDDVRDSPAITIARLLVDYGARVIAYDPVGMNNAKQILKNIEYVSSAVDAVRDVEALLILTEWEEFLNQDFAVEIKNVMKSLNIFDFRNLLDSTLLRKYGYNIYCIGKKYEC